MVQDDLAEHKEAMRGHSIIRARDRVGIWMGPGLRARILREIHTGRGIHSGLTNIYWVILDASHRRATTVRFLVVYSPDHDEIRTVLKPDYGRLRKLNQVQLSELHALWL